MTNSDMTPAWQTPLKDLHLARVLFRKLRAEFVTKQTKEYDTSILAFFKSRQLQNKPFPQDFSNQPDDIKRIKNLENALYLAEQAFDKFGDLNLRHPKNYNPAKSYRPKLIIEAYMTSYIAEAYEACQLLLNLMTDAEQNFRNEINYITDGLAHILALANNPNTPRPSFTSHDVGLTIGRAIDHRKPIEGQSGYDLLTYCGAVFPDYPSHIEYIRTTVEKFTSRNPEYTPNVDQEKMQLLYDQGQRLSRTIANSHQNSLYFVFNLISLIRQTHTLWTHIYQEARELNGTMKNLGREYLALLKYELLLPIFHGVTKLEAQLLLNPGRLSKPLMEQIKPWHESFMQTARLCINFDESNEHLLKLEDTRFIELRLKPIQQKMETSIEALHFVDPALKALDAYIKEPKKIIPPELQQHILALTPYMLETDKALLSRINKHIYNTWDDLDYTLSDLAWNWLSNVTLPSEEARNTPNSANLERTLHQLKQRWGQLKINHAFKLERYKLQIISVEEQAHRVLFPSKSSTYAFQVSEKEILENTYFLSESQPNPTQLIYQEVADDTYVQYPNKLSPYASWTLYRWYDQKIHQLNQAVTNCNNLLSALKKRDVWEASQTLAFIPPYSQALLDDHVMHQPQYIYMKVEDGALQYQVLKTHQDPCKLYLMTLEFAKDAGLKGYIWDHVQNQLSYIAENGHIRAHIPLSDGAVSLKGLIKAKNMMLKYALRNNDRDLKQHILFPIGAEEIREYITSLSGHHPGVIQTSSIPLADLGCTITELSTLDPLQQFLPHIFNELLERGHIKDEFKANCIRWYGSIQPYVSNPDLDARITRLFSGSLTQKISNNAPRVPFVEAKNEWRRVKQELSTQIKKLNKKRDTYRKQTKNIIFKRPSELNSKLKHREFLLDTAQFMSSLAPIKRQLHNSKKTCFKIKLALTHLDTNKPDAFIEVENHPWFQDVYVGPLAHATTLEIEKQLKQILAYETLQITRNEQLLIQLGYDLVLMKNLPNHDENNAISGEIYVDERSGQYIVRGENGEILRGKLEGVPLDQLELNLNKISLKKAILAKISKPSHTPQLKTHAYDQKNATHNEDDAFMYFGHIYEPVVMQEESQKKPGELQLSIENGILHYKFMHYGKELKGETGLQNITPELTEFNESTALTNDTLKCILKIAYTNRKHKIDNQLDADDAPSPDEALDLYQWYLDHHNDSDKIALYKSHAEKKPDAPQEELKSTPENRPNYLIKHTRLSQYLNKLKSDIYQHIRILSAPLKQELHLTHKKHLLPYPEVGAQNWLIDLLKEAMQGNTLIATLHLPKLNEQPKHDTLSVLKEPHQVLLFKRLLNMIHYLEHIVLEMEKVNNKELQVSYVMHLVISYFYVQEILPLLSELKQDPVFSSTYTDIAHQIEFFYKKINHESKYYVETNHLDDNGKNKQTALHSLLNMLKILPARLANSTEDFEKKHAGLLQASEKSARNIEKIIQHYNSSWSYILLLLDLPIIQHLLNNMRHDIEHLLEHSHEEARRNLSKLNTKYLATVILEADRLEHKLGLIPGFISHPIKEILDEFYKGLITPLTPEINQQVQLLCGNHSLETRIKAARSRKKNAKTNIEHYEKASQTIQALLDACDAYHRCDHTHSRKVRFTQIFWDSLGDFIPPRVQAKTKLNEVYQATLPTLKASLNSSDVYLSSIQEARQKKRKDCFVFDEEKSRLYHIDAHGELNPQTGCRLFLMSIPADETRPEHLERTINMLYPDDHDDDSKRTLQIDTHHTTLVRHGDKYYLYTGTRDPKTHEISSQYTELNAKIIAKMGLNFSRTQPLSVHTKYKEMYDEIAAKTGLIYPIHLKNSFKTLRFISKKKEANGTLDAPPEKLYLSEHTINEYVSSNSNFSLNKHRLSINPGCCLISLKTKPTDFYELELPDGYSSYYAQVGRNTDVLYYIDTETSSITPLPIPKIKQDTDAIKALQDTRKNEIFDAHDFKNMEYLTGHGCCLISLDTQPTDFDKLRLPVGYGSYYAQVGNNTDVLYYIDTRNRSITELPITIEKQKTRDMEPTKEIEKLEDTKKNKAFNTNDFKNIAYLTDHTPDLNGHTPSASLMIDINNFTPDAQSFEELHTLAKRSKAYYQGMIKTSKIAEAIANEQLTYLAGYRFKLKSFAKNNFSQAQGNTIYLFDQPKAYFIKGMKKEVLFTQDEQEELGLADITEKTEKLSDINFQKAILAITSKAGHTLVESQRDRQKEKNIENKKAIYTGHFNKTMLSLASEKVDLQNYILRPLTKKTKLRPDRLYIELRDNAFNYRVINPAGKPCKGSISLNQIEWPQNTPLKHYEQLIPYLPDILKITAKDDKVAKDSENDDGGHTRPHSLADNYKIKLTRSLNRIKDDTIEHAIKSGGPKAIDKALAEKKAAFNHKYLKQYEQLDAINQAVGEFRLYLKRAKKQAHNTSSCFESTETLESKTAILNLIDSYSADVSISPEKRIATIQAYLQEAGTAERLGTADHLMAYHTYTSTSLKSLLQCVFRLFETAGLYTPEMTQRLDKVVDAVKRHEPPLPQANNPWSFFSKTTREKIKEKISTPKPSDAGPEI